ncbi:MAG: TerC family protein [Fuerstiella sp.]
MDQILVHIMTLLMLTLLQAVLGFDNLLYISIESKRVPEDRQSFVRKWGIGLAIVLRIVLLVVVIKAISSFQTPFFDLQTHAVTFDLNVHALIVLIGGAFIIYTALKEIAHMLADEDLSAGLEEKKRSVGSAMFWIVSMNLVFSFDSILSAIALASSTEDKVRTITTANTVVMSLAIIFSGILMIVLSDRVSSFLQKNRMYEVLGLFVLFIVGIMLVSEGGHLAHLKLFGHEVEPMAKSTFYFVLAVLVLVDLVQGRYQRKLMARQAARKAAAASTAP